MIGHVGWFRVVFAIAGIAVILSGCGKNPWVKQSSWPEGAKTLFNPTASAANENQPIMQTSAEESTGHQAWQATLDEAANTNKLVMVEFVGSDWCRPCQKLEAEVLSTPEFQNWARERFVMYRADFPKHTQLPYEIAQANEALKITYESHVKGFPTVLVLDSEGQVISKMGYQPGGPRAWIANLDAQLQRAIQ